MQSNHRPRATCAVQMLLVAFSRRMCCSRVCSERRRAWRPAESLSRDTQHRHHSQTHALPLSQTSIFELLFKTITHLVMPTKRPGMTLLSWSLQEKKAAWGPPKPSGTPNLWLLPTAMSAPNSPGAFKMVRASRSVATTTKPYTHTNSQCI